MGAAARAAGSPYPVVVIGPGLGDLPGTAPICVPEIGEHLVIRVMIVEGEGLLRSALSAVLSSEADLEVIAEVAVGDEIFAVADRELPDVIVVDVDDGPGSAARLSEEGAPVLALSAQWTADAVRQALHAGVRGFASKDLSPAHLVRLVRSLASGEKAIDPAVAATVLNPPANPLTEREREVLRAAAEGLPPKEIASRLYLAPGTVRNRLSAILRKTGARSRLEAIRRAREEGWL
jgi:two-component system response regulator DesR